MKTLRLLAFVLLVGCAPPEDRPEPTEKVVYKRFEAGRTVTEYRLRVHGK